MSDNLEYLYGNFSGKSTLDKKIQNAEEILNQNKQLREESLEEIYDRENWNRLKSMPVSKMSFGDVEIFNEIKKKYETTNKAYDGSDVPQAEGALPDTTAIKAKIISTANDLVSLIQNRGISVSPIPEGASLQNILDFCNSFKSALQNSQTPVSQPDDDQPIKYSRQELLETKSAIEKMLRKLDGR